MDSIETNAPGDKPQKPTVPPPVWGETQKRNFPEAYHAIEKEVKNFLDKRDAQLTSIEQRFDSTLQSSNVTAIAALLDDMRALQTDLFRCSNYVRQAHYVQTTPDLAYIPSDETGARVKTLDERLVDIRGKLFELPAETKAHLLADESIQPHADYFNKPPAYALLKAYPNKEEQLAALKIENDLNLSTKALRTKAHSPELLAADPDLTKRKEAMLEALQGRAELAHFMASNRGAPNPLADFAKQNSVDPALLQNFMDEVEKFYPSTTQISARMDKELKDKSHPLKAAEPPVALSWQEARDLIINAFTEFHPEMGEAVRLAFDNGSIHATRGIYKEENGVCFAAPKLSDHPDALPTISLKFDGSIRNTITLAHELGHWVSNYFHSQTDAPSFGVCVAETFSLVAEQLVYDALLARPGTDAQKLLTQGGIMQRRLTPLHTASQARWEHGWIEAVKNADGTPKMLTYDDATAIYEKENMKMAGAAYSPEFREDWATQARLTNHFFNNTAYYNFSYGLAQMATREIVDSWKAAPAGSAERKQISERWLEKMKTANGNYTAIMNDMGVQVTSPDFVHNALSKVAGDVADYKQSYDRYMEQAKADQVQKPATVDANGNTFHPDGRVVFGQVNSVSSTRQPDDLSKYGGVNIPVAVSQRLKVLASGAAVSHAIN